MHQTNIDLYAMAEFSKQREQFIRLRAANWPKPTLWQKVKKYIRSCYVRFM